MVFNNDIYIRGSNTSRFLFQSSGNFIAGAGAKIVLVADQPGGSVPLASNIVWVTSIP